MFQFMMGVAMTIILVQIGRGLVRFKMPHNYQCPEQDCYFEVRADSKAKIEDAIVNHWSAHPMERDRAA